VTAILRKTFDLFAHAVANPEERLIPTRMLGMPRLSLPRLSVRSRFVPRRVSVRDRELFGTRWIGYVSPLRDSQKSKLVVGARPTTRSWSTSIGITTSTSNEFLLVTVSHEIDTPNSLDSKRRSSAIIVCGVVPRRCRLAAIMPSRRATVKK